MEERLRAVATIYHAGETGGCELSGPSRPDSHSTRWKGDGQSLEPAVGTQLFKDVLNMITNGHGADAQCIGNLLAVLAGGDGRRREAPRTPHEVVP